MDAVLAFKYARAAAKDFGMFLLVWVLLAVLGMFLALFAVLHLAAGWVVARAMASAKYLLALKERRRS